MGQDAADAKVDYVSFGTRKERWMAFEIAKDVLGFPKVITRDGRSPPTILDTTVGFGYSYLLRRERVLAMLRITAFITLIARSSPLLISRRSSKCRAPAPWSCSLKKAIARSSAISGLISRTRCSIYSKNRSADCPRLCLAFRYCLTNSEDRFCGWTSSLMSHSCSWRMFSGRGTFSKRSDSHACRTCPRKRVVTQRTIQRWV